MIDLGACSSAGTRRCLDSQANSNGRSQCHGDGDALLPRRHSSVDCRQADVPVAESPDVHNTTEYSRRNGDTTASHCPSRRRR